MTSGRARTSSRVAFAVTCLVFAVTVVLALREVLAVPDGPGDVTGSFVATVAGALGLASPGAWLSEHEQGRPVTRWRLVSAI